MINLTELIEYDLAKLLNNKICQLERGNYLCFWGKKGGQLQKIEI